MATKQKSEWLGFVDCALTDEEKKEARGQNVWEGIDAWLDELVKVGYRLVVSFDVQHDCAVASLTCTDGNSGNAGFTLTGRGPDAEGALQMLVYKHFVVLKKDWKSAKASESSKWG